jgi:hypothetical protein
MAAQKAALAPAWRVRQMRLDARDDAIRELATTINAPSGREIAKKVQDWLARPAGDAVALHAAELCRGKALSVRQLTAILAGSRQ